jgi:hypothetical protein
VKGVSAAFITRSTIGISASAWPRAMGSDSIAMIPPCTVSSTAAEQASSAVSMASTRMDWLSCHHPRKRMIQ